MTSTRTREIVRAYHDARNNRDMPAASDHLAENFSFASPLLKLDRTGCPRRHRLLPRPGQRALRRGVGHPDHLPTATALGTQRTAEHLKVGEGGLAEILLIFDAPPWRPLLTAIGVHRGASESPRERRGGSLTTCETAQASW